MRYYSFPFAYTQKNAGGEVEEIKDASPYNKLYKLVKSKDINGYWEAVKHKTKNDCICDKDN